MPGSEKIKRVFETACKKLDKVVGNTPSVPTTCPTCYARYCSQNSKIALVEGAKQICADCIEEMECQLHDELRRLRRENDWSEYKYYTKVKTPKCRRVALENLYREVEQDMLGRSD
ncbi:hypothetical protein CBER1_11089 [Cercospora berteroae]|uniref:Uncharacterized protein n=1 Tax=Cercospora berteroae TaxID=357750 RepID=A0A2S6CDZ7_9PEZI|nr:hypothetical protein CBER1_11089 [Cercospora berteroae]